MMDNFIISSELKGVLSENSLVTSKNEKSQSTIILTLKNVDYECDVRKIKVIDEDLYITFTIPSNVSILNQKINISSIGVANQIFSFENALCANFHSIKANDTSNLVDYKIRIIAKQFWREIENARY